MIPLNAAREPKAKELIYKVLSSRQLFLFLALIPRLRPGLLSLRSVLASSQILVYSFAFDFLLCSFAFGSFAMFKIYHG